MSKVYKAKKDFFIYAVILISFFLPPIVLFLDPLHLLNSPIAILPLFLPFFLLMWFYIDTSYQIIGEELHYKSGFLHGCIQIKDIKKIENNKTLWSGLKPALARHGLIIHFRKYDNIYIAPTNNEDLINDLLSINPAIKIIE
jgi:hypothetical protein